MTTRTFFAALAFASLAAPLAAHADAPSGDINTVFAIDQRAAVTVPDTRSENRLYVEGAQNLPSAAPVSREQVLKALAEAPLQIVGA